MEHEGLGADFRRDLHQCLLCRLSRQVITKIERLLSGML